MVKEVTTYNGISYQCTNCDIRANTKDDPVFRQCHERHHVIISFVNEEKTKSSVLDYADKIFTKFWFVTLDDKTRELYYYNDSGRYEEATNIIEKELFEIDSEVSIYTVREVTANIKRRRYKKREEFDSDPDKINLKNGIFNLRTGKLEPHSALDYCRTQLPIGYDPNARPIRFVRFLNECIPNYKHKIMVIEFLASILLKKFNLEKILMLTGDGSNGKSTLIKTMYSFFGKDNLSSTPIHDLINNRFALANLDAKLGNFYTDIADDEITRTGKLKGLVSGDSLTVEKKGQQQFDMVPFAKLVFSCNKMPRIQDDSDAIFRRFEVVDFPIQFRSNPTDEEKEIGILPKDPELLEKLTTHQELSGTLNLFLVTIKRLLKQKKYSFENTIETTRKIMKDEANPIRRFFNEFLIEDVNGTMPKARLEQVYFDWCKKNNELPLNTRKINTEIKQHFTRITENKARFGSGPVWAWCGIKFVPGVPDVPISTTQKTKDDQNSVLFSEKNSLEQVEQVERGLKFVQV